MKALPFLKRPHHGHFLAQVKGGIKGRDLFQQGVHQILGVQHRDGRNVVDRLVRVQFRALPARLAQGINKMRLDAEQSQFKNLEQPAGAGANNQCIGLYNHGRQSKTGSGQIIGTGERAGGPHAGLATDTLAP